MIPAVNLRSRCPFIGAGRWRLREEIVGKGNCVFRFRSRAAYVLFQPLLEWPH
jgi:hypothetical protein